VTQCSLVDRYQSFRAWISRRVVARSSFMGRGAEVKKELLQGSAKLRLLFNHRSTKCNPSVFTKRMCF
jgi:hypothetical protein